MLAIDPGTKRVGVAVSDPGGSIAVPLEVLNNDRMLVEKIRLAAKRAEAIEVVVGLPVRQDGTEGPEAALARALAQEVEQALGIPVHLVDERMTSKQASGAMSRAGINSRRQRGKLDQVAAAMLLQSYLDARKA